MSKAQKIIVSTLLLASVFASGCSKGDEIIKIHTDNAPQAIGPYEQAVVVIELPPLKH
ncbi:MAG: hypothetical protein KBS97_01665 [Firmicutes bacterium]|nr:hypothetical protein [Candidatus Fiminaster equi]